MTRSAFTLVETLLMLVALVVFSFTTLAVLKKDQFSPKLVAARFHEVPADSSSTPASPPKPATPAVPSPKLAPEKSPPIRAYNTPQASLELPFPFRAPPNPPPPSSTTSGAQPPESTKAGPPAKSAKAGSPASPAIP